MSERETPPSEPSVDPHAGHDAWARGVIERHVAAEEQLAQAGLRLALAIEQGATQAVAEGKAPDKDVAMAFARVARTVRMGGLLQARLIRQLDKGRRRAEAELLRDSKRALAAYDKAAPEAAAAEDEPDTPVDHRKLRVARIVERVAKAEHENEDTLERLMDEACDRLDDEDIYGDVLKRPIGELVSLICRDLDLHPDWGRLSEEAWAQAEIDSGAEGSPFFSSIYARPPPLAGEVARRDGGGIRLPLRAEVVEGACGPRTSPLSAPDG